MPDTTEKLAVAFPWATAATAFGANPTVARPASAHGPAWGFLLPTLGAGAAGWALARKRGVSTGRSVAYTLLGALCGAGVGVYVAIKLGPTAAECPDCGLCMLCGIFDSTAAQANASCLACWAKSDAAERAWAAQHPFRSLLSGTGRG